MAEAIAKHWLKERDDAKCSGFKDVRIASAGTHAKSNKATSPEAIVALAKHQRSHEGTSQLLTHELMEKYDVIFTMTQDHFTHTKAMIDVSTNPTSPTVLMLHPQKDLEDPLGKGQQPYDELVDEFITLIPSRLKPLLNI